MSDAYQIEGITITPEGGGFYTLTHDRLVEPVKERGKENAEARAKALAEAFTAEDAAGVMAPQDPLPEMPAEVPSQLAQPGAPDPVAALQAVVDAQQAQIAQLMEMATRTVITDGGPVANQVPADIAREFAGIMTAKEKAALSAKGIEVTDIVLEENETIPPTGLFVGHNGRSYMIMPGEPVTVPNFVLDVLKDAVMSAPTTDSKTQQILGYRNRSKYPYRVL